MDSPKAPLGLSFDKAQYSESPTRLTCQFCQRELLGSYFEVNGQPACESCRHQVEASRGEGSSIGKAFRALVGGGLGGLVGAGIYYAVLALTGYEVGLVAIVVGLLVGIGVRWGSGGVGGRRYQVLAVAITYLAIVSTHIPFIIDEIRKQGETAAAPPEPASEFTMSMVLLAFAAVLVVAMVSPFLAGIQNIIGILIIGFALYEAWKVNAHSPLVIEGPFQIGEKAGITSV